jgi:hypothetical protein
MARRIIPKLERLLRRSDDVRSRMRELDAIKDAVLSKHGVYHR